MQSNHLEAGLQQVQAPLRHAKATGCYYLRGDFEREEKENTIHKCTKTDDKHHAMIT